MNKQHERSSEFNKLLVEEEFILMATEEIWAAMESKGVSKANLAKKLKKTKPFITQLLSGSRNMTLRTFADVADALGFVPQISFKNLEMNLSTGINNEFGNELLESKAVRYFACGNIRQLHPPQFLDIAGNHEEMEDWSNVDVKAA